MVREELILAAVMKDRKVYDTAKATGYTSDFGPIASAIYGAVEQYYNDDGQAGSVNRELIESRLDRIFPNSKHADAARQFIRGIPLDCSSVAVDVELRELHREKLGSKLALAFANGSREEEVQKLWSERQSVGLLGNAEKSCSESLIDVFDTSDLEGDKPNVDYIKLWPKGLNDHLDGGAIRGHHVLIFARPETGKTLFAINLVAGCLHQQLNVLYVANEEPGADIRDRIRGRLLKISKNDVRRDRTEVSRRLSQVQLGKIGVLETNDFQALRSSLVANQQSDEPWHVVVVDQVRNMRIKSDGRTAELEAAGIEARAIAKEFNVLVISITQAGDSATNKIYLDMSDVDSSKTGLPASADLMIGIGSGDSSMKDAGMLGISLCKNKLSGLHSKFTVQANFSTGVID